MDMDILMEIINLYLVYLNMNAKKYMALLEVILIGLVFNKAVQLIT